MKMGKFIYEGKAKQLYETSDKDLVIVHYKDDATAGNGAKKGTILNKGVLNNEITTIIFKMLEENNIKTHFVEKLNDRDQLCQRVKIFPLEVIVRNIIAGSMAKRLGITEGTKINNTIFELCYKNDEYGDPLINNDHAVALNLASYEELDKIYEVTMKINELLKKKFEELGIILVDFKIEFGKNSKGEILLADEITPDTCRFWDMKTMKKLDKDRFRFDLGDVEDAYLEIFRRLGAK
ncbi:phosphoribosylaminoimidazolesuccinocarboxamide synthase [Oceanivirga miroungae]|uniref:Phosphoribosylaminoimidazole-succinocarboxamide synthase n=1 Tax=Oceanivirga miroungae TaxID=1130046 RepID=A0A6I8M6K5_9FUSO|nr:phosphoribosylaminoimidazolesuccinocarboxamide synthase [Oceanivirga miroungae]VWL85522.1 phosphoribosylaminoimidazolesuccinocarboxamide synthase [Oceanivirga miroungae]